MRTSSPLSPWANPVLNSRFSPSPPRTTSRSIFSHSLRGIVYAQATFKVASRNFPDLLPSGTKSSESYAAMKAEGMLAQSSQKKPIIARRIGGRVHNGVCIPLENLRPPEVIEEGDDE